VNCEQKVKAELIQLGLSQQELEDPDLVAYIRFSCLHGTSPKWIADQIFRLKNLKELLQGLKTKYPELSDEDLGKLSKKYMNGSAVTKINGAANDIAKDKASDKAKEKAKEEEEKATRKKKKSGPND
jgi:hypothetical protein